ncbi:MAG: alkaline phosphatase family protein [Acidobacteriota bacterium]|nr:alkaline phosphatase family protein [Acidobacteriota bacterium]
MTRSIATKALSTAAIVAGTTLLAACAPERPLTENDPRVMLVGIDGAEWSILRRMIAEGELPSFSRIVYGGASGDLLSIEGRTSPAIWTTVVTGAAPEEHGIPRWTVPGDDGEPRLVTSNMRRRRTLWEILSAAGLRSTVVGWIASWPATPLNGFMVTSYSPYATERDDPLRRTANPMKGSLWKDIEGQTWPPELIEEILPLRTTAPELTDADLARFVALPIEDADPVAQSLVQSLRVGHASDITFARVADKLFGEKPASFMAVYLGGIDVVSHRFWRFMDQTHLPATELEKQRFGTVIEEYYRFVDERLGGLLERVDDDTTLVVCSDHGFGPARTAAAIARELSGVHRMKGIVILYGRGVVPGAPIEGASVYDLAPTILALLRQPLAGDMRGRALLDALDENARLAADLPPVATYETGETSAGEAQPIESPTDDAMLEQLRSLGYIK